MADHAASAEAPQLVEHFFRHESTHLVAVLTRAFGVRHLDLVEDTVQEALLTAMQVWSRRGVPKNPGGWIYRVARNRLLDALRRRSTHQRLVEAIESPVDSGPALDDEWWYRDQVPDSLLRMLFVCAHPALDRRSQIALTLKVLCGFSLAEIARGLLLTEEATKKRVQRARRRLAKAEVGVDLPPPDALDPRLAVVLEVLYLLFNEGYSTAAGDEPLRDDICEEAARLCHVLCHHPRLGTAEARALLALMLAHSARLDARLDSDGGTVLLADQDRALWDRRLIAHAELWLARSRTDAPSRYHYEAAISLTHCRAASIDATDWPHIVALYDRLLALHDSPLYVLNRAVARGESGDVDTALAELDSIRNRPEMRRYHLVDCAAGRLHELAGDRKAARRCYTSARAQSTAPHEQRLLDNRLTRLHGEC
ncbi:MAG: sigma-70 family RNA polymerase sigma factor [Acidobacteriota bacterium]